MVNVVYIDGLKLLVPSHNYRTIFQLCSLVGKQIPPFCFNGKLTVAGNCRICLVEVQGLPKPIASCATPIQENMVIFTKSPLVLKARESVMEFILVNHPLDCPICDQGGMCDLQDLSLSEGREMSRFFLKKRAVADKVISTMITTKMTRCIHCTKCVRLSFQMGVDSMGVGARGYSSEIFDYNYASNRKARKVSSLLGS